jgi:hypothetical protein
MSGLNLQKEIRGSLGENKQREPTVSFIKAGDLGSPIGVRSLLG